MQLPYLVAPRTVEGAVLFIVIACGLFWLWAILRAGEIAADKGYNPGPWRCLAVVTGPLAVALIALRRDRSSINESTNAE